MASGVRRAQIIFIAVGTPTGEDGSADLQHVLGGARDLAKAMNGYKVVVNKSTVPVGTNAKVTEVVWCFDERTPGYSLTECARVNLRLESEPAKPEGGSQ
jgi:UDP-glucose 6-dehydrogenase